MAKRKKEPEEVELNMTPMIDVVFNLIIFFMLVADLSKKDIEILTLPWSDHAIPDQGEEELRVILNIVKKDPENWKPGDDVEVKYKAQTLDLDTLTKKLLNFANRDRDMDHPMQPSEVFALIRCDEDIRWREVQWVMQACAHPDVRIYKIQFATRKPPTE